MTTSSTGTAPRLLKLAIFGCICSAAVLMRLYSVIRFESIIHEFDPWFNFRATKYLSANGFYAFLNWFDDRTWYPLGRVTGGTLYPGLMVSANVFQKLLTRVGIPLDIRNVCVLFAPAFSGLTAFMSYKLTAELKDEVAGLLAALFVGMAPGYISRSVAGSYDNEAIAITLLMSTFYFWIKAMKIGSILYAAAAALGYFYMVSAWGGYVFITNIIPLHVLALLVMGRYNPKLYVAYSTWYGIGTIASMQIPFVGFLPVRSSDHMGALGVFGLIQLFAFADYTRSLVSPAQFKRFILGFCGAVLSIGITALFGLTYAGVIAPWGGRFYSLWDTEYAKIHIPIIASVSEHQPTAWPAFFMDNSSLIWLFPVGVWLCIRELRDEHVFLIVYSVLGSYFAGVMVRLMLTLTPIICVASAMVISSLLDVFNKIRASSAASSTASSGGSSSDSTSDSGSGFFASLRAANVGSLFAKSAVVLSFFTYIALFVFQSNYVTQSSYSSPSVVLSTYLGDGTPYLIDDFREAYYWLRMNTPKDAVIASWWDYGYQIGGMADRTTLVDNNTWNNTHIATVGKAMCSSEDVAYPILKAHDVDYVLVVFGGLLGYSGDDMNKFLWMVRISEGIWPDEVDERKFFNNGQYRVDDMATDTMKESLMYKMSYYRYNELNGGNDRVRGQRITQSPTLDTLEEAYTTQNWLVRLYKVKDLDVFGRDLHKAANYERNKK